MALTLSGEFSAFRKACGTMRIPACTARFSANIDATRAENSSCEEATWETALWNYWKPANHQLQTVLSKACLESWRAVARPIGLQFSEPAVRFPCLVAGILSVGALALLLKRLGFARAGVIAAFLLSVHPWHVRYAIELRGYIFTLLFGPLMIYCLIQAIDSGRWRWWMGFAASEFALLYAYPGCLYMVVIANFCGAIALFRRHSTGDARWQHLSRLARGKHRRRNDLFATDASLRSQLLNYFERNGLWVRSGPLAQEHGRPSPRRHPLEQFGHRSAGYQELQWAAEAHPYVFLFLRSAALGFFVLGALRLGLSRPAGWIVLGVLLIPGVARLHHIAKQESLSLRMVPAFHAFRLRRPCRPRAGLADGPRRRRVHRFAPPVLAGPRRCQLLCRDPAAASLACYTSSPAHEGSRFA